MKPTLPPTDRRRLGRPRKYTAADRETVLQLRQDGLSQGQIEKLYGIPEGSVHYLETTAPSYHAHPHN